MLNKRKKLPNYKLYRTLSKLGVAIIGIVSVLVFAQGVIHTPATTPMQGESQAVAKVADTNTVPHIDITSAADSLSPRSPVLGKKLYNIGYISYFSEEYGIPVWVSYITSFPFNYGSSERPKKFIQDFRVRSPEHSDYSGSGYDRGHMAPNYAISRSYGTKAQYETFYTTNIAPQAPKLNRKQWMHLEQYIANDLATEYGQVLVFVGPVLSKNMKRIKRRIAVPEKFWAVVMVQDSKQNVYTVGFIIPQVPNKRSFKDYAVSVDTVEAETGIDFFPILSQEQQKRLESSVHRDVFRLN